MTAGGTAEGGGSARGSIELRVRYAETDQMRVVYHAHYLAWCEVGRTELIRTLVQSYASLEDSGIMLAVAEASLRYHAPARYDDRITVETTLTAVRSRTLTFDYLIVNADSGNRLVSARTVLVSLDPDGRSISLPPHVRDALARAAAP